MPSNSQRNSIRKLPKSASAVSMRTRQSTFLLEFQLTYLSFQVTISKYIWLMYLFFYTVSLYRNWKPIFVFSLRSPKQNFSDIISCLELPLWGEKIWCWSFYKDSAVSLKPRNPLPRSQWDPGSRSCQTIFWNFSANSKPYSKRLTPLNQGPMGNNKSKKVHN
jgi:hypothetical protein